MSRHPRSVLLLLHSLPHHALRRPGPVFRHFSESKSSTMSSPPGAKLASTAQSPVADLRVNYSAAHRLDDASLPSSPFQLFSTWFADARASADEPEPNAMCLATATAAGRPSARMVLLKKYDTDGFVWYTNYNSRKALQLAENPYAALSFWWPSLERHVRIEGIVHRVSPEESDLYFESRPLKSQLAALASDQSAPVEGRDVLERRWEELVQDHLDDKGQLKRDISRPPHWGGFRLVPDKVEFWKGREARLHDRIVYEKVLHDQSTPGEDTTSKDAWARTRLQP